MTPETVPDVVFHTRVRNDALGGPNPFEWKDVTTADVFRGKRVVLFAVPAAFSPACSESHLPGYERLYDEFRKLGVDAVVCLSVNDAFVMFQWAKSRDIEKVDAGEREADRGLKLEMPRDQVARPGYPDRIQAMQRRHRPVRIPPRLAECVEARDLLGHDGRGEARRLRSHDQGSTAIRLRAS